MPDEKNICENCANEYDGDAQQCDICGMDGLGPCCAGELDHPCENSEEDDD